MTPACNVLDLTPQGRGNFYAQSTYPTGPHWSPR